MTSARIAAIIAVFVAIFSASSSSGQQLPWLPSFPPPRYAAPGAAPDRVQRFIEQRNRQAEAERKSREAFLERLREQERVAQEQRRREQEAYEARIKQSMAETARRQEEERKPPAVLRRGYTEYIFLRRCFEAREGYLSVYVNDRELERARAAVRELENWAKEREPELNSELLWDEANRAVSTMAAPHHQLCRAIYAELDAVYRRTQVPIEKDF